MSNKEDYYALLEVARDASDNDIKKAYRKLAMKYHPDRNPNDKTCEEKFKKVSEAYEILSNPEKRKLYDMHGHAGVDQSFGAGGARYANASDFGDIFGDIFGDFFGGGRGGPNRSSGGFVEPGADLRYSLDLTLEEAVFGKEVTIKIRTLVKCDTCHGSGSKNNAKPAPCKTCNGAGQVRIQQGFFSMSQTCGACHGRGSVISDPCSPCNGQGRKDGTRTLAAKVPAGVDNGDRIRLAGEGEAGPFGGPSGDLYVQIRLKEHDIFTRDGIDLHCEVPIGFSAAALGSEIDVPTLNGRVKLKIPAETQTGKLFRLRGKGVTSVRREGPGDLYCKITVETPVNLTKAQQELFRQLDASLEGANNVNFPKSKTWFTRVKKFFEEMKF
jgi:molecular chaperone DnaJ